MARVRLIARLDIKGSNLIKGVHLEGLRIIGDPQEFARRYYEQGIDEIIYMDTVASLYGRNNLTDVVEHTATDVFVPITVGGGIRGVDDVRTLLRSGADKVAVNTAATKRPALVSELAEAFGSQCVVLGIEAKRNGGGWECFTENGRERTGLDVIEWARQGQDLGAGEILLTSVDREGTTKGFDTDLVRAVSSAVSIPVIASGGMGSLEHFLEVVGNGGVSAVAAAHIYHYGELTVDDVRAAARGAGLDVRTQ